ncbi:MAG: hypothetical protein JOZ19_03735 [Rubrobacter sp.]|nr:hypothetical protein [Rubrobacter sp.]
MRVIGRWVSNIIWFAVWAFLFFLCLGTLGDTAAYVGIPALIVAMLIIWYVTDRRHERSE